MANRKKFSKKRPKVIQSTWLVRVLAGSGSYERCRDCGGRMFAGSASGLCPVCRTRHERHAEGVHEIAESVLESSD